MKSVSRKNIKSGWFMRGADPNEATKLEIYS